MAQTSHAPMSLLAAVFCSSFACSSSRLLAHEARAICGARSMLFLMARVAGVCAHCY